MSSYDFLRRIFNPVFQGSNINAWLAAIATGDDTLRNNADELFKAMFAATATGQYLDIHGSNNYISRPNGVGISDAAFRRIITETTNYELSSNALLNVLDIYYDNFLTRAFVETELYEPFVIVDGSDLSILIDEKNEYNIELNSSDFESLAAVTAEELASVITQKLKALNALAFALKEYDSTNQVAKVRLFTDTLGTRGSVRVTGGSANNTLKFNTYISTTQDSTTQFTVQNYSSGVTNLSGTTTRFTWTGGTNPGLSAVSEGDFVNVGGGFNSANTGSYPLLSVVNGPINYSYFEVNNASSFTQSVTISSNALYFFRPEKRTIFSETQYAAVVVGEPNKTKVFIPATTSVVERSPTSGGGYISDVYWTLNFSATTFTAGETVLGLTSSASGILISQTVSTSAIIGDVSGTFISGEPLFGEQSRATATISSVTHTLNDLFDTNYLIDFNDFIITNVSTTNASAIQANSQYSILTVGSTNNFSLTGGYFYVEFGYDNQEFAPYRAVLNDKDLLMDASYKFQHTHPAGSDIMFVKNKNKATIPGDGSDLGSFATDVALARNSCVSVINRISASGLTTTVEVNYPSGIGLGNYGRTNSDVIWIWGT